MAMFPLHHYPAGLGSHLTLSIHRSGHSLGAGVNPQRPAGVAEGEGLRPALNQGHLDEAGAGRSLRHLPGNACQIREASHRIAARQLE